MNTCSCCQQLPNSSPGAITLPDSATVAQGRILSSIPPSVKINHAVSLAHSCTSLSLKPNARAYAQSLGLELRCRQHHVPQPVTVGTTIASAPSDTTFLRPEFLPSGGESRPGLRPVRLASLRHPLIARLRKYSEEAFGRVREFTSPEELTALMENTDELRLQPLLIRLRLLGPDHPDTIYFIRWASHVLLAGFVSY
ncbi:unnamed protein product [Protopolystoma xenopodis]|uniref:Uncharacterized protein n=1 Tax=Protopolystoma xenopodis TaxID=117903 RepID=A0A448X3M0_9PLAT|nr:unnamed protein product [Protopolystoma xenopodis]